jgi:hypothetical protein
MALGRMSQSRFVYSLNPLRNQGIF